MKEANGLGKRLAHLRESQGVSIEDLAKKINVPPQAVAALEAGKHEQGGSIITTLDLICEHLGVSLDVLVRGQERHGVYEYELHTMDLRNAHKNARAVALGMSPEPTLYEMCEVCRMIDERFDMFVNERHEKVAAWRRDMQFELDGPEIARMFKEAKKKA